MGIWNDSAGKTCPLYRDEGPSYSHLLYDIPYRSCFREGILFMGHAQQDILPVVFCEDPQVVRASNQPIFDCVIIGGVCARNVGISSHQPVLQ